MLGEIRVSFSKCGVSSRRPGVSPHKGFMKIINFSFLGFTFMLYAVHSSIILTLHATFLPVRSR
jgi:hypothetical protein